MAFFTWLRNKMVRNRRSPLVRPSIELLEERSVPSTLTGLGYSTLLGGGSTYANAIAVDSAGNTYVTGRTGTGLPTLNPMQAQCAGGMDAFVAKLDPSGALLYSTYLGGSGTDIGLGIAVDSAGNACITGQTTSTSFPTLHAFQNTYGGGTSDAFLTRLGPDGTLLYSTYLGGNNVEDNTIGSGDVAVDDAGNAYVTGLTNSTTFPTTGNALQTVNPATDSATSFVTKLNTTVSGTSSLVYSTYLTGTATYGIAVDATGAAYLTGWAATGFTTTPGAFLTTQPSPVTTSASFAAKLSTDGSALVYATYLNVGQGWSIAVDGSGDACLTGECSSSPTTPGAFQTAPGGGQDGFVTELNAAGSGLVYSTYLGGSLQDQGRGIALDSAGHLFVTGFTSGDFPIQNAFQPTEAGQSDAFLAELDPSQTGAASLIESSYLGGSSVDQGYGIAVDGSGNAYVSGETESQDFPTVNAFQTTNSGLAAFVTEVLPAPSTSPTSTALSSSLSPALVGQSVTFTASVTATTAGAGTPDGTVLFLDSSATLGAASVDAAGQAQFTTSSLVAGLHHIQAIYLGSATFEESNSPMLVQVETGSQASTTNLKSSANPSVYGQTINLTATVKPASGSSIPTGSVTFLDGSSVLGTASLSGGVAALSTSTLGAGSHTLTAAYNGDATFAGSSAPGLTQTVTMAATRTTLKATSDRTAFGQLVTFTASVAPVAPGAGAPSGTILFMDGSTVLGTATLSNGQATFTTAALTKGKHSIKAVYSGDVDFVTSTSAGLTETIQ
jgi:hypothetical protein